MSQSADVSTLRKTITDELFKALGFSPSGLIRKLLDPIVKAPSNRFAQLIARFDEQVASVGLHAAIRGILPRFVKDVRVGGAENIPQQGPLLVVSNHPGTYDGLVIAANLQRDDLKVIVSGGQFARALPVTQNHLIHTTLDTGDRMAAVRSAIRHLRDGGSLLIFPSGGIDPDPALMPPAAKESLKTWSRSIELFLRKAPQTQLLMTMVSNVLSPEYLHNPLTRLRKKLRDRQRIAEFLQVIRQMLSPSSVQLTPQVTFAPPMQLTELLANVPQQLQSAIVEQAQQLLADHVASVLPQPA
jgi:hypothetical protein